jgi:hypothetical protein
MSSEFFRKFLAKSTCAGCSKVMTKGVIYDWINRFPWCADCFKALLETQRHYSNAENSL